MSTHGRVNQGRIYKGCRIGKGISAEAHSRPFALGIRDNTRMTVTPP